MVLNLVLNGAEAMGQSGRLTLRTDLVELEGDEAHYWRYTGRPLEAGPYIRLEVSDEAGGIARQDLAHIFDPFFTTKEQGRGLGLAAVLGIVRGHKAGLAVRGNSRGGTTFEVLFPVSAGKIAGSPRSGQQMEGGAVLVIDDEEIVREAVTDILALEDIDVLSAEDGYQGVALYRAYSSDVQLILLDLSMPGLSGEETYHQLRELNPDVRIILSSGYSAGEVARQFQEDGPAGFLQKPYSVTTLVEEVRRHLGS
jgi:CheY-like chemotaxis protein